MTQEEAYETLRTAIEVSVENRHGKFIETAEMNANIWQLAECLTADNPKIGVLLCGGTGNGKTTFMRSFQLLLNTFDIPNPNVGSSYGISLMEATELAHICKTDYSRFLGIARNTPMLGIDDLGNEPTEILDYGNAKRPLVELLSIRYDLQLFTFISTNLAPGKIRATYGDRIADRLNEMVEKIVFEDSSFRCRRTDTVTNDYFLTGQESDKDNT